MLVHLFNPWGLWNVGLKWAKGISPLTAAPQCTNTETQFILCNLFRPKEFKLHMVLTIISTSGYTYLSPLVIVFNRHNWGWGSCTKKRQSSVFEQETIISELNHSSLVLWFSPFPNICTHALNMKAQFLVGYSSCINDLPEVLWRGRALANEQRTRACLSSDRRLQLTDVTWVIWGEPPGSSKDLRGGTVVSCASLMNLPAWCSCMGHGVRPAACSTSYLHISVLLITNLLFCSDQNKKKRERERDLTLVCGVD